MTRIALKSIFFALIFTLLVNDLWEKMPTDAISSINSFLKNYDAIMLSLGTILIVSIIAVFTTILTNKAADSRQRTDRALNSEIKLSEFRQAWINSLRGDISILISIASNYFEGRARTVDISDKLKEMREIDSKIRLRLNPFESEAQHISDLAVKLVDACEQNHEHLAISAREELANESAIYLKNEWDNLKKYLIDAK